MSAGVNMLDEVDGYELLKGYRLYCVVPHLDLLSLKVLIDVWKSEKEIEMKL